MKKYFIDIKNSYYTEITVYNELNEIEYTGELKLHKAFDLIKIYYDFYKLNLASELYVNIITSSDFIRDKTIWCSFLEDYNIEYKIIFDDK